MNKLILIIISFFLTATIFAQEQPAKKIQQQKTTKNASSVQGTEEVPPTPISTPTTDTNHPVSYTVGRDGNQHVVKKEKSLEDFSANTINAVDQQLKELYGKYYEEYGLPNIVFYAEFYERCEYIPLNAAPTGIRNISSLNVIDKYNPQNINHDNLQKFNAKKFNVLKYQFDYYNKTIQYYRIYNTDMVLKVNKLN